MWWSVFSSTRALKRALKKNDGKHGAGGVAITHPRVSTYEEIITLKFIHPSIHPSSHQLSILVPSNPTIRFTHLFSFPFSLHSFFHPIISTGGMWRVWGFHPPEHCMKCWWHYVECWSHHVECWDFSSTRAGFSSTRALTKNNKA